MTMSQAVSRTPAELARRDLSARQAILAACVALTAIVVLDLIDGRLGAAYSVGFVLVVVTVPLSVDVRHLFPAGVLPPVLLLASLLAIAILEPSAIRVDGLAEDASLVARLIAGVIDHGMTLVIGHGLALGLIVLRIISAPER